MDSSDPKNLPTDKNQQFPGLSTLLFDYKSKIISLNDCEKMAGSLDPQQRTN